MKKLLWTQGLLILSVAFLMTACGGGAGTGGDDDSDDNLTTNRAPIAAEQNITTNEDTAKNITLTGTDTDGDPLTYIVTANPAHGSLGGVAPDVTYTPNANYHGADSFKFKVNDGTVDSAKATVRITINTTPTASDFSGTLDVNETLLSFAWKNTAQAADADGDALNASLGSNGNYGIFSISGDTLTYRKTIEGHAADTVDLIISDGKASVSVTVRIAALYWKQVAAGNSHSAAIKSDGSLWLWGRNHKGEIGDGTLIDRLVPVHVTVEGDPAWKQVSVNLGNTLAIEDDGTLWAWGENNVGQLGIGSTVDQKRPVEIAGSTWKQVSAGVFHSAGIQSDDSLWTWGGNRQGQRGNGNNIQKNAPEKIGNAAWKLIAAGGLHTVGIQNDDTLWAWGYNRFGQLGDGTVLNRNTPVKIGNADWKLITAARGHTVGIQSSSTLWAWGSNSSGHLGDGTMIDRSTSVPIGGDAWKQISGGFEHTVAIRSDGKLFAWGSNNNSQLGDGTNDQHLVPVPIGDASWAQIAAGHYHTVGIRDDGTLWAWGWNGFGQLGDTTLEDRNSPVPVSGRGL